MKENSTYDPVVLEERLSGIERKLDSIMGLLTQFKVHGPWKDHELEYIKAHYSTKKTCDIAAFLFHVEMNWFCKDTRYNLK